MKISKMIAAAALVTIITVCATGCATSPTNTAAQTTAATTAEATDTTTQASDTTAAETTAAQSAVPAPVYGPKEPQALYVTINGANVRLGMKYADVKAALGGEAKPAEGWEPCVGDGESTVTSHFYTGSIIDEDPKTGIINRIYVDPEDTTGDPSLVTLAGKLKVGGPDASLKEIFGEPKETETDEDGTAYTFDYDKTMLRVQTKDGKIVSYNFYVNGD